MSRSYYGTGDLDDDLFEAEEAARRRRKREEMLEAHRIAQEVEAKAEAIRKARATEVSLETNRRQLLRQYEAAGVEPPSVDASGRPLVSLPMLLTLGWSIEHHLDGNVLARPVTRSLSALKEDEMFGSRGS